MLWQLPPRRRQRLRTARLTRRIQRLDSPSVVLFISMVVTLGHRHRLMAGEVVDLLDSRSLSAAIVSSRWRSRDQPPAATP